MNRSRLAWLAAFSLGVLVVYAIRGDWLGAVFGIAGGCLGVLLVEGVRALGRAGDRHRAWDDPHRPAE